jgi:type II secretory pathway component GspD/PulD (secretin)
MNKKRIFWGVLIILGFVIINGALFADIPSQTLDDKYREASQKFYRKNYVEAINLFEEIRAAAPSYRSSQIIRYIRAAEGELGKLGVKAKYRVGKPKEREIEIKKEGEFEKLAEESEQVLLDTFEFFEESKEKYDVTEFKMLKPQSTLNMAQKSYETDEFNEAIRLANKARFQLENIIQEKIKKEKPVLGELGEKKVTLNLTNGDLEQTLKLIYDLTGANIVLSKGIEGRVTINVKDLPLKKVMDLICESNQLKYIQEEDVIKIMTEDEYKKRGKYLTQRSRKVFSIKYGDASAIAKALRETFKREDIIYDPRTNSIIANVENEVLLNNVQQVVASLDTPVSQVLLEAKIIEVTANKSNTFSIDWLISSRLVDKLDTTITGPKFGDGISFTPGDSASLPGVGGAFAFGITNSNVNSLINALATQGDIKLIQAPRIMCLNGTNAIIRVVQNYPYIIPEREETYDSEGRKTGTTQTVTVYEEEVGTEFDVTPIIQRNRNVFLSLNIIDSRLVELRKLTAVAAGQQYETEQPVVSTRETTQNVTLFDGQTLVIGGMIQNRTEKSESGVPFLRRIPLLGYLFKKPTYVKQSNELLLFLTPHVITTYKEAGDISYPEIEKSRKEIDPGLMDKF